MFATIPGPLPRLAGETPDDRLRAAIALQVECGIGLLSDGGALEGLGPVEAWRQAQRIAGDHPVKAVLPGPYLSSLAAAPIGAPPADRRAAALAAATHLQGELLALAAAGCPFVQVDEPSLAGVGEPGEAEILLAAHAALTATPTAPMSSALPAHLHLSLGAGAQGIGDRLFTLAYRSFGFDLIGGPDDWRIAVRAPGDRGVVCGAIDPASPGSGDLETAIWAAGYAASTQGRGLERVGLTTAPGLERLTPEVAAMKLRLLGEAARLAGAPREELDAIVDPRAIVGPSRRRDA